MNCCNKPPKGGTTSLSLFIKMVLVMLVVILTLAYLFG